MRITAVQIVKNTNLTSTQQVIRRVITVAQLGARGYGVPTGGNDGDVLSKDGNVNFITKWIPNTGGGGGISDAPNNANAYVRSGLAWVIGYTKTAIDNLISSSLVGYATQSWVNSQGFITNVISALGFTPYNATNPSGFQTASQVQVIADAKVANTITNGVTTSAPNQDAVFDALALKANDNNVVHLTGNETISGIKTFGSIKTTLTTLNTIASIGLDGTISGMNPIGYPSLTEIAFVKGVTSAIQTQLNDKQPLSAVLTATTASFTTGDETKIDKYPSTATNGKILQGNGTNYVEVDMPSGGGGATPQTGQIIVTSGTSFTTPANITTNTVWYIELIGGGGGGGALTTTNSSGSGGGGGGYCFIRLTGLSPSTSYICAIGQGGATATAGGNTILTAGDGFDIIAQGGGAGVNAVSSNGGGGGGGIDGDINITGQAGEDSTTASGAVPSASGGSSPKGWGLGGLGVRNATAGRNGTGYGAGGGAGKQNATGGSGSNGIIYAKWFN